MYIGDIAKKTDTSIDTLRYYEKIGLIQNVPRDAGGRRVFTSPFIAWVEFIKVLKATGMPLKQMREYAHYRQQGAVTNQQRLDILAAHEQRIVQNMAAQQKCLELVQGKIKTYIEAIEQTTDIPISACINDPQQK